MPCIAVPAGIADAPAAARKLLQAGAAGRYKLAESAAR